MRNKSHTIQIKPLSVNKAWQGRRFKTIDYKQYEKALLLILPKIKVPSGKLSVKLEYGFSSSRSDIDNPTKLILDCFQKKYKFDDSSIYELYQKKVIVKKGEDYFKFSIDEL